MSDHQDQFTAIKNAAREVFLRPDSETIAAFVSEVLDERNQFIVNKALNESDREFISLAAPQQMHEEDPITLSAPTRRKLSCELSGPGRMWKQLAAQVLRHFKEYEAFIDDAHYEGLL